jgi:hypothetical protein
MFVEDEGRRQHIAEIGALEHIEIGAQPNLHPKLVGRNKHPDCSSVFPLICRDSYKANFSFAVFLAEARQHRKFFLTRPAPGGPKIHDCYRSAQVGDLLGLPR